MDESLLIRMFFSPFSSLVLLIHNYGDLLAVIFYYHRGTENTETLSLFAHRETAMGKKPEPSVRPSLLIGT
jgi:hypothetical protein